MKKVYEVLIEDKWYDIALTDDELELLKQDLRGELKYQNEIQLINGYIVETGTVDKISEARHYNPLAELTNKKDNKKNKREIRMGTNKKYFNLKVDLIFVFRHVLQQNFEKRVEQGNLRWKDVKKLEDGFLEEKLQDFARKMEIDIIGTHELNYLSNKILDDLVRK